MSNAKIDALKNIRFIAGMVRGLVELEPDLARAGSIDKLIAEGEAKLTQVADEQKAAEGALAATREATNKAQAEAAEVRTALAAERRHLDEDTAGLLGDARAALNYAKAEANRIIEEARAKAKAEADGIRDGTKQALVDVTNELADKRVHLDALNAETAATETRLESFKSEIAALRAKL